jgi:predicted metal-dependent HD superfamily phosphohydrolase
MAFALSDTAAVDLRRRYAEPHRRYHDERHLDAVLANVDLLAEHSHDLQAVRLAALFHDAIYAADAHRGDGNQGSSAPDHEARRGEDVLTNERASAELARSVLTAEGAPANLVDEVERLVMLTEHHDVTVGSRARGCRDAASAAQADPEGAVLCDADLAVLGGRPADYAEYASDVRAEWMHLDDRTFALGRIAVLESLLERRWLFTTSTASAMWEEPARRNLATELTLLRTLT